MPRLHRIREHDQQVQVRLLGVITPSPRAEDQHLAKPLSVQLGEVGGDDRGQRVGDQRRVEMIRTCALSVLGRDQVLALQPVQGPPPAPSVSEPEPLLAKLGEIEQGVLEATERPAADDGPL